MIDRIHHQGGTYADGFAALAFGLADGLGGNGWKVPMDKALRVSERRPRDSEFDQMARLLLRHRLGVGATVDAYDGPKLVSNNWIAMRALNLTLQGGREARAETLWSQVLDWQQPDGLFVDSPGGLAPPVTYHAKFCAVLALALKETGGPERLSPALEKGLWALSRLVSPAGVLLPYGRSRHSLFGYAASILALRAGAGLYGRPDHAGLADMLLARVQQFQQPDGHIPCILNSGEATRRDWDVYVNNPDYNAYCAALLLLAERYAVDSGPAQLPQGLHVFRPFLTFLRDDTFVAVTTAGASVPRGTPFFCDHRYYGMQPLWVERSGKTLLEPEPFEWNGEERASLVEPRDRRFIPYVEQAGRRFCVRVYDSVASRELEGGFEVKSEGGLTCYEPVPRWRRGLDRFLTRGPAQMYRVRTLPGARFVRRLTWNGRLTATTGSAGKDSGLFIQQGEGVWP